MLIFSFNVENVENVEKKRHCRKVYNEDVVEEEFGIVEEELGITTICYRDFSGKPSTTRIRFAPDDKCFIVFVTPKLNQN